MLPHPVKLAMRSVSRVISRRVTTEQLTSNRPNNNNKKLDDWFNRLDNEAKRTGRVATRDLIGVFSLVQSAPTSSASHALMLLRCCGSLLNEEKLEKRNELLDQVWDTLKNKQPLDISHYNALLQVYIENQRSFNPLDFLRELEEAGQEPNRVTYQRLIHVYCMRGDIDGATKILEFMKQKDIPVNESVFNSLILGYATIGDYKSAKGTLDIMLKSDVDPTSVTYTALLKALAKGSKDSAQDFVQVLDKAEADGVFLMDRQKLDIVKELILNDADEKLVDRLLDSTQRKVGYITDVHNITMDLLNAGKVDQAIKLFRSMPVGSTARRTKGHGMLFISQMVKSGQVPHERVFALCKELKDNGLNEFGIYRATQAALESGDRELGRIYIKKFLEEVDDPIVRPHYFWPLLAKSATEDEVFSILEQEMDRVPYSANGSQLVDTLEMFVWPKVQDVGLGLERLKKLSYSYVILLTSLSRFYLTQNNMSAAIALLRSPKYSSVGVLPQFLDHEAGAYLARTGTPGEAVAMLKEIMRSAPYHTDSDYVGIFLDACLSNGGLSRDVKDKNVVTQVLKLLKQERIRISPDYMERIVKKHALNEDQRQLLTDITLGTNEVFTGEGMEVDRALSRSVDDLENDLIELKSKGMNTRGTLRSLLLRYCRTYREPLIPDDDAEEAPAPTDAQVAVANRIHEIVQEIEAIDMQMTDSMRSVLVEFYFLTGQFEKAYALRGQITPDFVVDDFKIFTIATALIRAGRVDEALRLLQEEKDNPNRLEKERTLRQDDRPDRNWNPNEKAIFRLANAAAQYTKDPKIVSQVLDLAQGFRGDALTNVMLGPKIKVHLLRNDLNGALEEFTNCVSKYKQTPWSGELMRILIEREDSANLQLVTDLAISCHGESNTLYDLAFAFVRAKKVNQARKVVAASGLRPSKFKIGLFADRLIREKDIETLKHWVDVALDIRDLDHDELYFNLIRGYKSVGDHAGALSVWTEMQQNGVIPSGRTLAYLGNYLKSCGVKVPFAIPEAASQSESAPEPTSSEAEFVRAIRNGDVAKAYEVRKERLRSGRLPSLNHENMLIEKLVENGMLDEACEVVHQLSKEGKFPVPRLLRNLSYAVGKKGKVDEIEKLKPILPPEFTNQSFFTTCVADAYIESGQTDLLLDKLESLKPFPLGAMMNLLSTKPEIEVKLSEIAKRLAQHSQYYLPQNMLWLHKMKNRQFEEADGILKSTPALRNNLLFSTILKTVRENQDLVLAEKLVQVISETNLSSRALGVASSMRVDVLIDLNRAEEAEKIVLDAISSPVNRVNDETGDHITPTQLTDFNRMTLVRLYNKLTEKTGRDPGFKVPERIVRGNGNGSGHEAAAESGGHEVPAAAVGAATHI